MRLIEVDVLKARLELDKQIREGSMYAGIMSYIIDSTPTVDAAPVKHGRWIVDTKFGNDVLSGGKMVTCSCCGKGGRFDGGSPYCSNCGAKMDEEKVSK